MAATPDPPRPPRAPRLTAQVVSGVRDCRRRLWLQNHRPGLALAPSSHIEMLRERSREHERTVAARFPDLHGPIWKREGSFDELAKESVRLLRETRTPLARAPLLSPDGRRSAVPSFLYWDGDTLVSLEARLALRPGGRGDFALQCAHTRAVTREAAGITIGRFEIVNGNGETIVMEPAADADYRAALAEAEATLGSPEEPDLLLSHSACRGCAFYPHCWDMAEAEGRIEVLPEVQSAQVPQYHALGVRTIEQLAALDPASVPRGALRTAAKRAVRVAAAWRDRRAEWTADPKLPTGPLVWFDLEGDSRGEEAEIPIYLWGIAFDDGVNEPRAEAVFAGSGPAADREAWERFVARATELLDAHPGVRFVHWDQYEPLWLRRYAERLGAPAGFLERLTSACYDLKRALDQCVRLPLRSYSIKHVAPWMGFAWRNPDSGSEWSVAQFQRANETADPEQRQALLDAIREYNEDDLWAMRAVWRWLVANRPKG